jgi:hypothetical protein
MMQFRNAKLSTSIRKKTFFLMFWKKGAFSFFFKRLFDALVHLAERYSKYFSLDLRAGTDKHVIFIHTNKLFIWPVSRARRKQIT